MSDLQPDLFPPTVSRNTFRQRITSPQWRWTLFIAVGAILILAAWLGLGKNPTTTFDLTRHNVRLDQIVDGGPGKDGIPAILHPRFVPAAEATFLLDGDRVLGLNLGAEAKTYPIKILNWHEIVNDTIDGHAVVVTYCPLCGTGIAFDATIQGRRHTFGVSGLLYQSDLLMYDHQTESLWSQVGMHAVAGPLTGERLTPMFLEHTTWAEWRAAHPATLVLSTETGSFRNYDHDPYLGYADRRDLMFDTTHFDPRYHPKERVVGVEINGVTKAYPFSELEKARPLISDQIGGRSITIRFNQESRSASVLDVDGTPIPSIMGFWFAWYAFHPDTQVFKSPEGRSP
ncbi:MULTISPECIES: DUF3179 domain-containing protein [Nitrospira]|uniref:DUF3179 domain-containing protein n=2 Tax=Nitrospira TaxID=1234 RepID=A0AA86MZD7_9BACT|nr:MULTISPECIES: DUF3179 domain-containing protein [Nitrospira]CAE6732219.1 conserved hypothetical protein [Nitrospira defluvii]CAI4031716.1 hypothetical protein DNFV4_02135 [Nitrospira tepida]